MNQEESGPRLSRRQMIGGAGSLALSVAGMSLLGTKRAKAASLKRETVNIAFNPRKAVNLTLWTIFSGSVQATQQQIADSYKALHPEVSTTVTSVPISGVNPSADLSKLLTAIRSGTGPDIYILDRYIVGQVASIGGIEDLSKYITKSIPKEHISFAWNEAQYRGKTYAVPFTTDLRAIFYNKDVVTSAGLDPEELDIRNGAVTVDRMQQINDTIVQTDSDGNFTRMGFVPWSNSQGETFYTWGFAFGGVFANEKKCEVTPTDKGVVASGTFLYNWAKHYGPQKIQTFLSSYGNLQAGAVPAQGPLYTGRVAMEVNVDEDIVSIKKYAPQMNYGIAYLPIPKKGDKPTTWSGGFSLVIPKGAKNPDAAWGLIEYMTGPKGQLVMANAQGSLPTNVSLLRQPKLFSPNQQIIISKLLPITHSRPVLPTGAIYEDQLVIAEQQVYMNQQKPKEALQSVATHVNPQLKPFCPLT